MTHHHGRKKYWKWKGKANTPRAENKGSVAQGDKDIPAKHNHGFHHHIHKELKGYKFESSSLESDKVGLHVRQAPNGEGSGTPTVVVATVIHVVLENGSTVAVFTVPTLPATVSNSQLGLVTIPAESESPIVIPSLPAAAPTAIPESPASPEPPPTIAPPAVASPSPTNAGLTDMSSSPPQVLVPSQQPINPVAPANSTTIRTATSSSPTKLLSSSLTISTSSSTPTTSTSSSSTSATSSISISSSSSSSSNPTSTSSSTALDEWNRGDGGNGSPVDAGTGPFPTFTGGADSGSNDSEVSTPKIVGGVIGGVSGVVLLVLLALLLFRWRKRKDDQARALPPEMSGIAAAAAAPVSKSVKSRRSSDAPLTGGAYGTAGLLNRWRTSVHSSQSGDTSPSDRGFQRLGGRKITSVLESGGDGYDDAFGTSLDSGGMSKEIGGGPFPPPATASTFDSHQYMSQSGPRTGISQPFPAPPLGRPASQESDSSAQVVLRPSPARTPMTSTADVTSPATPRSAAPSRQAQHPPMPALRISISDGIGRTHGSADGSRTSRFTEGV
ncbi:hypothetical protein AJ80_05752 [Polytolypa hystricis UAMH7299]|uniref:Mid2 domain-containing protein n=1 Tax=Polytolypa hystricis (strain UAMH7299) TaxID=1447883 RepID=A0A2B7Y290_POLH7|nr:hypothetical protein AJ80_05752 [Polytolypa hystricis UAMH7299]